MSDIVLVHGTTQTASGYWRLVKELMARKHRAFAVDVPGGLSTACEYAEIATTRLPDDVRQPVVVAHSGSGVVLPALAERLDALHQVWLAAAVADYSGGRSLLQEMRADPMRVFTTEWAGVDPTADPVLATYFLFHDADLATLRQALPTVAPCDLSAVFNEVP